MFGLTPGILIYEFRFDIAGALLASNTLNNSLMQISETAKRVEQSMMSIGVSMLTSMGAIPSGMIGAMGAAVKASESFDQTALSWANLLSANKDALEGPIHTHDERMKASHRIMKDIAGISKQFGIPQKEMSDFSKLINANLIQERLQGVNLEVGHTMARQLIKASPNLGLDPTLVMGQLLRAIQGGASTGDPLMRSLINDTDAMQKFRKTGIEGFNILPAAQRVKILNDALNQFSKDDSVNLERFKSLTNQLQLLKDIFMGFDGILTPLGDKIKGPIVQALAILNKQLDVQGRQIIKNVAEIFGRLAPDPHTAIVNITQAQRLHGTVQTSEKIIKALGHWMLISVAFNTLSKLFPALNPSMLSAGRFLISIFSSAIDAGVAAARFLVNRGALTLIFRFIPILVSSIMRYVIAPLLLIIPALLTVDRAIGHARARDAKKMMGAMAEVSEWGRRFFFALDGILMPFNMAIDSIAKGISGFFMISNWVDVLRKPMDWILTAFEALAALMMTVAVGTEALGEGIGAWLFKTKDMNMGFGDRFDQIYEMRMRKIQEAMDKGDITPKTEVHIGKVTIENKFKENMEPDRIAFTMRDQLLKLANNNIQAKGSPLFPAYGRP